MHSVISSVNNAIELTRRLKEISKNIEDAEFKNVLADLNMEMAEMKLSLATVTEENAELKSELTKLKHSRGNEATELVFSDFAYFTKEGDGPFCSGCYDTGKRRIRLVELPSTFSALASHECPSCKQTFGGKI